MPVLRGRHSCVRSEEPALRDEKTVAVNRKARHDYSIEDSFEAGIVLTGTEIKSVRAGKVSLAEAYARVERGEAWGGGGGGGAWGGGRAAGGGERRTGHGGDPTRPTPARPPPPPPPPPHGQRDPPPPPGEPG